MSGLRVVAPAIGSNLVTSTLPGTLRTDARSRQGFFALTGAHA
ncbi:hypothetical protein ACQP1K_01900 [Sphaerimonospora sp. CA-214678]